MLLAERHHFALLPRGVQLDLVDGRPCAGLLVQPLQVGGHEVAYAERAGQALVTQLDEGLPGVGATPVERRGPVNHVHVHVVELEEFQGVVECLERGVVALLGVAQLGGDPQGFTLGALVVAGSGERTAHAGLVVVSGGAVDVAVSGFQRGFDDGHHALVIDA